MRLLAFIITFGLAFSASAVTNTAASASRTHVAAAIALCNSGDTCEIPAGDETWSSAITITKAITIRGAGTNSTIIRNAQTRSTGYNNALFSIVLDNGEHVKRLEISRIRFYATTTPAGPGGNGGVVAISGGSAARFSTSVVISQCMFERFNFAIAAPYWFGVVAETVFLNNFSAIRWSCVDAADLPGSIPYTRGSSNWFFMEDSELIQNSGGTSWLYIGMDSEGPSLQAVRYSTYRISNTSFYQLFDMHGNADCGGTSSIGILSYRNNVIADSGATIQFADIRGGRTSLCYSNVCNRAAYVTVRTDPAGSAAPVDTHVFGNYENTTSALGGTAPGDMAEFTYPHPLRNVDPPPPADPVVTVEATDPTATEAGTTTGTFTVSANSALTGTVNINTSSGTATRTNDYAGTALTLTFAGETSKTVTITPVDDASDEGPETVILTVTSGTGYTVGNPSTATVTITDNDGVLVLIPERRRVTWAGNVGIPGGIPHRTTVHSNVPAGTSATIIQAVLNACPSNGVVQLDTGNFTNNTTISIPSYVTLRGSGSNTVWKFQDSGTISVQSSGLQAVGRNITSGLTRGSTNLSVVSSSGLAVGDVVLIDQLNGDPIVDMGDCDYCSRDSGTRLIQWNHEIQAVDCTPGTNALAVSVVAKSASTGNQVGYSTPSFTPATNATLILFVTATDSATIADGESVTNTGTTQLTWWRAGRTNFNTLASATQFISAWVTQLPQGLTPFSMTVVCNLNNAGTGAALEVVEVQGAAQTAAYGTNAIVQTTRFAANASANPTNKFSATGNNGFNSVIFAVADDVSSASDNAANLSWTELWETNYSTPSAGLAVYYSNAVQSSVFTVTNTASSRDWATIALEVRAGTNCTPLVTIWPPLPYDLTAAQDPEMVDIVSGTLGQWSGIEDMKIVHIGESGLSDGYTMEWRNVKYCWLRNVEIEDLPEYGMFGVRLYRCEFRHNYLHGAALNDFGSGKAYGLGIWWGSSWNLFEDNIAFRLRHSFTIEGGGAGNVYAYNYSDRMFDAFYPTTDFLMGDLLLHGSHPMFTLYEGNVARVLYTDNVHGSSSHTTAFRNFLVGESVGQSVAFMDWGLASVSFDENSLSNNVIGNILGANGLRPTGVGEAYSLQTLNVQDSRHHVYILGQQDRANLSTAPGWTEVNQSILTNLNWDFVSDAINTDPTGQSTETVLPASLYLTNTSDYPPTYFGDLPFPPFSPEFPDVGVTNIPAGFRYTFGFDPPATEPPDGPPFITNLLPRGSIVVSSSVNLSCNASDDDAVVAVIAENYATGVSTPLQFSTGTTWTNPVPVQRGSNYISVSALDGSESSTPWTIIVYGSGATGTTTATNVIVTGRVSVLGTQ